MEYLIMWLINDIKLMILIISLFHQKMENLPIKKLEKNLKLGKITKLIEKPFGDLAYDKTE